MLVDVHQHVWTAPLLKRLAEREQWPFVRRDSGVCVLHCASERPYVIDVAAEIPTRRAALVQADGLDLAVVAISSPIGVEALEREESLELIDAHLEGVQALGARFAAWGPVALDGPDPEDVDRLLANGCVGVSMPAGALADPERLTSVSSVLERVAQRGVPLFVHPGRAPGDRCRTVGVTEPPWWLALTDYVAQMQAAWLTFMALGRREHPMLRVVFAMLAGGAPLHSERLRARGGPPVDLRDPGVYYETSSYGPAAIEALTRLVGESQLLYGSDRPVVDPLRGGGVPGLAGNGGTLFGESPRAVVAE